MSRPVADYIALALLADLSNEDDIFSSRPTMYSGSWEDVKLKAEGLVGFKFSDHLFQAVIRSLADCNLVRVSDDQFSGSFLKVYSEKFAEFCKQADKENRESIENMDQLGVATKPSDYPAAHALLNHQVFEDFKELGDDWARSAIEGLRRQVEEVGSIEGLETSSIAETPVPAADRIVSLDHNQSVEFESKTSEVIDAIEDLNQIDGGPGLRELMVGQLKAGRELIRSGSFKLYVLQVTLFDALAFLAKRYESQAIGALAATLLAALSEHFGLTS